MELPRRILVVDDDEMSVKAIRSQLMMYDFEVDDITDPKRVIPHLHETNKYGLFIVDVNMPGKDGITLATQIRNTFRSTVPILFVSGDIDDETANRIRRLKLSGHVGFLKKGEFDSKILFDECMAMLKEHTTSKTMLELTGRVSHLQETFGEGMAKLSSFMDNLQSAPPMTQALCDQKVEALVRTIRKDTIGITLGETNKKIEDALKPETLADKIDAALKSEHIEKKLVPDVAFSKVREAQSWKIAQYFILVIFAGLAIFWGSMWNKAEHADDGVRELAIKQKQTIDMVQQQTTRMGMTLQKIQRVLVSDSRHRIATQP